LKKVAELDFDTLLCGHNPCLENGRKHILMKLDFLENLYGEVVLLWEKGLGEGQIFKSLKLRESRFIKYFCCGNVSMLNGVRSAVRGYQSVNYPS